VWWSELVLDAATKASAAGVRVCAFSPSLISMQLATTDETGWYRLAQLPPGLYVLVYEGREFQDETWGMDRPGWRDALAKCGAVPGGRGLRLLRCAGAPDFIGRTRLVARGIDCGAAGRLSPDRRQDAVVAETHRPRNGLNDFKKTDGSPVWERGWGHATWGSGLAAGHLGCGDKDGPLIRRGDTGREEKKPARTGRGWGMGVNRAGCSHGLTNTAA
jgi:hypothetical protein